MCNGWAALQRQWLMSISVSEFFFVFERETTVTRTARGGVYLSQNARERPASRGATQPPQQNRKTILGIGNRSFGGKVCDLSL